MKDYTDFEQGLKEELNEDLKTRVIEHRNRFVRIFKNRYKEMLPNLIIYENDHTSAIDFLKVEVALRGGYDMVIGENVHGELQVIGFMKTSKTSENPIDLFSTNLLDVKDIKFIIPKKLQKKEMTEISHNDNCETGNFVILRNKNIQYVNDREILLHYTNELAEIVLSRFSIAMQAKIITFFKSEVNDETINELVTDLYNGAPYSKVSKLFDPEEQIINMQTEGVAQNLEALKREYQNKLSELNNMLGINSLAVEKQSGVSDTEAKSNRAFTTSNANIYLKARQHGLDKLNKRYNLELTAMYNDEVTSEFSQLQKGQDEAEQSQGLDEKTKKSAMRFMKE